MGILEPEQHHYFSYKIAASYVINRVWFRNPFAYINVRSLVLIDLSNEHQFSKRVVYSYWYLFGDFGGFKEGFLIIFTFLIAPISEHSFLMKAISKLYLAKTDDRDLFESKKPEKHQKYRLKWSSVSRRLSEKDKSQIAKNREPKLRFCDSLLLFLSQFPCCCNLTEPAYQQLYDTGTERMDKELDVVKILKRLRNLKILLEEQQILSRQLKFKIKHSGQNVIDLTRKESTVSSDYDSELEQSLHDLRRSIGVTQQNTRTRQQRLETHASNNRLLSSNSAIIPDMISDGAQLNTGSSEIRLHQ